MRGVGVTVCGCVCGLPTYCLVCVRPFLAHWRRRWSWVTDTTVGTVSCSWSGTRVGLLSRVGFIRLALRSSMFLSKFVEICSHLITVYVVCVSVCVCVFACFFVLLALVCVIDHSSRTGSCFCADHEETHERKIAIPGTTVVFFGFLLPFWGGIFLYCTCSFQKNKKSSADYNIHTHS